VRLQHAPCRVRRVRNRRAHVRSLRRALPLPRPRRLRRLRLVGADAGQAPSTDSGDKAHAGARSRQRRMRHVRCRWRATSPRSCRAKSPPLARMNPPPHPLLPFILILILIQPSSLLSPRSLQDPPPPFRPPSSSFPQEEEDPLLLPPELRHLLPHTLFSYEERRWDYYHSYGGPFPSHGSSHRKRPEPPSPPWPPSPAPSAIVGCVVNERRARAAPPPPLAPSFSLRRVSVSACPPCVGSCVAALRVSFTAASLHECKTAAHTFSLLAPAFLALGQVHFYAGCVLWAQRGCCGLQVAGGTAVGSLVSLRRPVWLIGVQSCFNRSPVLFQSLCAVHGTRVAGASAHFVLGTLVNLCGAGCLPRVYCVGSVCVQLLPCPPLAVSVVWCAGVVGVCVCRPKFSPVGVPPDGGFLACWCQKITITTTTTAFGGRLRAYEATCEATPTEHTGRGSCLMPSSPRHVYRRKLCTATTTPQGPGLGVSGEPHFAIYFHVDFDSKVHQSLFSSRATT